MIRTVFCVQTIFKIKEPTLSLFFCLKRKENIYISWMVIYVTSVSRPLKESWMSFIQSLRNRIPLSICWPINFVGYRWLTVSYSSSNIVRGLPPKNSAAASNKGFVCSHNAKRQKIISRHVMTFECGMSALEFQQRGNLKSGYIVLRKLANLPTINLIIVVTDVLRYLFGIR